MLRKNQIARELAAAMGYTNKRGTPYSASCVKSKVEVPTILDTASGAATAAGVI
jgi:hypothetical protein